MCSLIRAGAAWRRSWHCAVHDGGFIPFLPFKGEFKVWGRLHVFTHSHNSPLSFPKMDTYIWKHSTVGNHTRTGLHSDELTLLCSTIKGRGKMLRLSIPHDFWVSAGLLWREAGGMMDFGQVHNNLKTLFLCQIILCPHYYFHKVLKLAIHKKILKMPKCLIIGMCNISEAATSYVTKPSIFHVFNTYTKMQNQHFQFFSTWESFFKKLQGDKQLVCNWRWRK